MIQITNKTKLNKEQIKAINSVLCNLDELNNKPRRLFSSLTQLNDTFNCDNKGQQAEINRSLSLAQEIYYEQRWEGREIKDQLDELKRWKSDLVVEYEKYIMKNNYVKEENKEQVINSYENGIKAMYQIATSKVLSIFYPHTDATARHNFDLEREVRTVLLSYEEVDLKDKWNTFYEREAEAAKKKTKKTKK